MRNLQLCGIPLRFSVGRFGACNLCVEAVVAGRVGSGAKTRGGSQRCFRRWSGVVEFRGVVVRVGKGAVDAVEATAGVGESFDDPCDTDGGIGTESTGLLHHVAGGVGGVAMLLRCA